MDFLAVGLLLCHSFNMSRYRTFAKILTVALVSSLALAACSSGWGGANSESPNGNGNLNLQEIQNQLSTVAPECKLEKLKIAEQGKVSGLYPFEKVVVENLISFLTNLGFLPNESNLLATSESSGWQNSPDENVFSWKLNAVDEIFACNTAGVPVSELSSSSERNADDTRKFHGENGGRCEFSKPYSAKNSREAEKCLEVLRSLERDGEWVVITTTKGVAPKDLVIEFMDGVKASYGRVTRLHGLPMAVTDSYILNFDKQYKLYNDAQNADRNQLWTSIVRVLGATTWESLDEDYGGFQADYSTQSSVEKELGRVVSQEVDYTTSDVKTPEELQILEERERRAENEKKEESSSGEEKGVRPLQVCYTAFVVVPTEKYGDLTCRPVMVNKIRTLMWMK